MSPHGWLARLALGATIVAVTAVAGCRTSERTGLVVEVRATGLQIGVDLDEVVARINDKDRKTFNLGAGATQVTFPFRFSVVPNKSSDEQVTIEVVGRWQGADKVRASAVLTFIKNEVHLLSLTLQSECVAKTCPALQTCIAGDCKSNQVTTRDLPEFMSGSDAGGDTGPRDGGGDGPRDRPEVLPDGAVCLDGDARDCSCGAMAGGSQLCQGGKWGACAVSCAASGLMGPCAAGVRVCDETMSQWGLCSITAAAADTCAADNDDNCNGIKNEGCPCTLAQTRTCDKGGLFGKCAAGNQTCDAAGKWSACSVTPGAADTCAAGNDDNCNGNVNEGCPCVQNATRACSAGGLFGKCAAGMQTCNQSVWSACSIAPSPTDSCTPDNDDNCNGTKNDGCTCVQGQTRTCAQGGLFGKCAGGTQTCDATGKWGPCSITASVGDTCVPGNDDNCNGTKNDACLCVTTQTRLCSEGGIKGKCGNGTQPCDASGRWGACSVAPASADACTPGDDSTCNGVPNEKCVCIDNTTQLCSMGGYKGKCGNGQQTCAGGVWGACSITPSPADTCELGNDDDCDGNVNENCPCINGRTRSCADGGYKGKCAAGTQTCASGVYGACSITPSPADTCEPDNDDNCNGAKNDMCTCVRGLQRLCSVGGAKGRCAGGMQTCTAAGQWGGCSIQPAGADSCDSVDNDDDCDGKPFENCACKNGDTRTCPGAAGQCGGTQSCSGGQWSTCSVTPVADSWTNTTLTYSSEPWRIVWPPSGVTPVPTASSAQGGQVSLPYDTVIRRVPGLKGGYVVSFNVTVSGDFAFHVSYGGSGSNPAIQRTATGQPQRLGGLIYGDTQSFGTFGSWNGTNFGGGAVVKMTLYVKATGEQLAAAADAAPWDGSGFVSKPGMDAEQFFQLVGSNSPDYARGPAPTATVGNITGCAGLTDAQVQAMYDAKRTF